MNGRFLFCQGGFEYKRAIVDCIINIVEENPESKEAGLAHLCEFIEDCEHTVLANSRETASSESQILSQCLDHGDLWQHQNEWDYLAKALALASVMCVPPLELTVILRMLS